LGAERFRGFKSPDARRTFILAGCGVATLFLALQLLMPLWLGGFAWPSSEAGRGVRLEYVHAQTVVLWRGELWYVASEVTAAFEGAESRANNRLVRLGPAGPQTVCILAPGAVCLLAPENSLWIFATDGVSKYDGKNFSPVPADKVPASASQPFLLGGLPAVAHPEAEEWAVAVLDEGRWTDRPAVLLRGAKNSGVTPEQLKVLMIGDKAYVLCLKDGSVYCREGDASRSAGGFPAGWELVCPAEGIWATAAIGGSPTVFALKPRKDELGGEIVGFSRSPLALGAAGGAAWKQVFSRDVGLAPGSLGVAPDAQAGGFRLLYQALPWSVTVVRAEDGKLLEARRYGELIPAERGKALRMLLAPALSGALLLAMVLAFSRLMAVYRVDFYSPVRLGAALPEVRFASLARRAVALFIDFVILTGPLLAAMVLMFLFLPGIEDQPDSRGIMLLTPLLVGGAFWAVAAFFLLCYSLGRWGRTPGKWALGIRALGTDLLPCGFSRALLRSALLFVDGFLLNFTIGVLLIAFTGDQQRIGDLAARTIVIREPPHPAGAGEGSLQLG